MKKIVIAGAGFGGLEVALRLKKKVKEEAQIIIVNDNASFEFSPWKYKPFREKKVRDIPLNALFSSKGIKFVKDVVKEVDNDKKTLKLGKGNLKYDFLVLSLGSVVDHHGLSGKEHVFSYHTIKDAEKIKSHLEKTLKANTSGKEKEKSHTIVVVGGGPNGVGLIGEINNFLEECCLSQNVRRIDVKLILLETLPEILGLFPSKARSLARDYLVTHGVDVRTRTKATGFKKETVILKDAVLESKTIIWCGGVKPNLVRTSLKTDVDGAIIVNPYLQTNDATVYALGNCASSLLKYKRYDSNSIETTINQAKIVAHNLATNILGGDKKEFKQGKTRVFLGLGKKMNLSVQGDSVMRGGIANLMKKNWENSYVKGLK